MTANRLRLTIIIGSARDGEFAATAARWLASRACRRGELEVDLLDLATAWSPDMWPGPGDRVPVPAAVDDLAGWLAVADAFVIVTPERNRSFPAVLKAVIDWYRIEWAAKPIAFVCYGGPAGGLRAVEHLRQVLAAVGAVTVSEAVSLRDPRGQFGADGQPTDPVCGEMAERVLDQITWWARALRHARNGSSP